LRVLGGFNGFASAGAGGFHLVQNSRTLAHQLGQSGGGGGGAQAYRGNSIIFPPETLALALPVPETPAPAIFAPEAFASEAAEECPEGPGDSSSTYGC
jgi:hypothetical protein